MIPSKRSILAGADSSLRTNNLFLFSRLGVRTTGRAASLPMIAPQEAGGPPRMPRRKAGSCQSHKRYWESLISTGTVLHS